MTQVTSPLARSQELIAESYLVLLRIDKGAASILNRRLIALHPGESVTLGRTSKNPKTEFMAKTTNGYFDNPIVSRSHAILQNRSDGVCPSEPDLFLIQQIFVTDQASTHGTYVNGTKLVPYVAKLVENGDCIALGTVLEYTSREHLPTELEIGIVEMDVPIESDPWATNERPGTTNSFHPPDSDSEGEDNEPTASMTWRPFFSDIQTLRPPPPPSQPPIDVDRITLPPILHLPIQIGAAGVPDHSSTSSLSGDAIHHHHNPIIDLTDGNSWAAPVPVNIVGIDSTSDRDGEYEEDNEEEDDKQRSDYAFPYEYDAEDKPPIVRVTQIPDVQVFERMDDPPVTVCPLF